MLKSHHTSSPTHQAYNAARPNQTSKKEALQSASHMP